MPVAVFDQRGKLVWNRIVSGLTECDSVRGAGFHVFCHRGGAWHDLWYLSDPRLHELLYHVCEYRDAAFEPLLPSGGGGSWKHLCGTDFSDGRRRYQAYSDDGRDAAVCELRWQFDAEYTDHVCSRAGTLHAAAG